MHSLIHSTNLTRLARPTKSQPSATPTVHLGSVVNFSYNPHLRSSHSSLYYRLHHGRPRRLYTSRLHRPSRYLTRPTYSLTQSQPATGETEWTKNGRYTGNTELLLTEDGIAQVSGTASHLVGTGKLIDPARVVKVFVSPRKRAQQTFDLLFKSSGLGLEDEKVKLEEDVTEWDHGMYEGWLGSEIRKSRKERGLDGEREWSIWSDGCEDGE